MSELSLPKKPRPAISWTRKASGAMFTPLIGDPSVRLGVTKITDEDGEPDVTGTPSTVFTSSDELILRRNLETGTFTLLEAVTAPTGAQLEGPTENGTLSRSRLA